MARMVSDGKPYQEDVNAAQKRDMDCYQKAKSRNQLTFTVVEQYMSAPLTILEWVRLNFVTAPIPKLRDAFETALAMKESLIPKKLAD